MSTKNYNDIGKRTRDLPVCSAVPQPTAPPRASCYFSTIANFNLIRNLRALESCLQEIRSARALCLGSVQGSNYICEVASSKFIPILEAADMCSLRGLRLS
jgi:hypothetical protein